MLVMVEVTEHEIFNELHPNREPISKLIVSKTLQRFHETASVNVRPKSERPVTIINEENSLDKVKNSTQCTCKI